MDQSQYLVQALQGLQQPPQIAQPQGLTAQQLADMSRKAQVYQQANPGGSYLGHNLMQAGRNVMAAPGNAVNGFQRLAQSLPGMVQPPSPYPPGVNPQPQVPGQQLPPY